MKRVIIATVLVLLFIIPSLAQEEKIRRLEELEKQVTEITVPDSMSVNKELQRVTPVTPEELTPPDKTPESRKLPAINQEEMKEPPAVNPQEMKGLPAINQEETEITPRLKIRERVIIEDTGDETVIRIGKRGEQSHVEVQSESEARKHSADQSPKPPPRRYHSRMMFAGHLGGIELGYNNYSTAPWLDNEVSVPNYMELYSGRSLNFNIVSPPVSLGFTRRIGVVAALGLGFNNYRFGGNNSVTLDNNGVIIPVFPTESMNFDKSKLTTIYAFVPVILELQIPVSYGHTLNLGAGVIGAIKTGAYTKVIYYNSDGKQKDKNHSDFSLNMLRYGVTARAGYQMVQLYATSYLTPLFMKGKGPELYPFEIGIALTIND